jgi:hypothetical protein
MESSGFNNSNASKSQFRSVKDLNFSDGCSNTGVEPLLSKDAVYDRTLRNKRDIIWTIRDPSTRKVMARLKNPVVPISPLNPRVKKFLDLDDNVNNGADGRLDEIEEAPQVVLGVRGKAKKPAQVIQPNRREQDENTPWAYQAQTIRRSTICVS